MRGQKNEEFSKFLHVNNSFQSTSTIPPPQTFTKPETLTLTCTNCESIKANHSLNSIWKVSCGVKEKGTGCQKTTAKDPAQRSRPENRNHGGRRISNKSNTAIIYGVGSYLQK